MSDIKQPSKEDIEAALAYFQENNIQVPLFNILGSYAVDEANFLLSDFSEEAQQKCWIIAYALNKGIIDAQTFIPVNLKRQPSKPKSSAMLHNIYKTLKEGPTGEIIQPAIRKRKNDPGIS